MPPHVTHTGTHTKRGSRGERGWEREKGDRDRGPDRQAKRQRALVCMRGMGGKYRDRNMEKGHLVI